MPDPALIQQALQALEALKGEQDVDPSVIDQCIEAVQSMGGASASQGMQPMMGQEMQQMGQESPSQPPVEGEAPQGQEMSPDSGTFKGARTALMDYAGRNDGELPNSAKGRRKKKERE